MVSHFFWGGGVHFFLRVSCVAFSPFLFAYALPVTCHFRVFCFVCRFCKIVSKICNLNPWTVLRGLFDCKLLPFIQWERLFISNTDRSQEGINSTTGADSIKPLAGLSEYEGERSTGTGRQSRSSRGPRRTLVDIRRGGFGSGHAGRWSGRAGQSLSSRAWARHCLPVWKVPGFLVRGFLLSYPVLLIILLTCLCVIPFQFAWPPDSIV